MKTTQNVDVAQKVLAFTLALCLSFIGVSCSNDQALSHPLPKSQTISKVTPDTKANDSIRVDVTPRGSDASSRVQSAVRSLPDALPPTQSAEMDTSKEVDTSTENIAENLLEEKAEDEAESKMALAKMQSQLEQLKESVTQEQMLRKVAEEKLKQAIVAEKTDSETLQPEEVEPDAVEVEELAKAKKELEEMSRRIEEAEAQNSKLEQEIAQSARMDDELATLRTRLDMSNARKRELWNELKATRQALEDVVSQRENEVSKELSSNDPFLKVGQEFTLSNSRLDKHRAIEVVGSEEPKLINDSPLIEPGGVGKVAYVAKIDNPAPWRDYQTGLIIILTILFLLCLAGIWFWLNKLKSPKKEEHKDVVGILQGMLQSRSPGYKMPDADPFDRDLDNPPPNTLQIRKSMSTTIPEPRERGEPPGQRMG